MLIYDPEMGYIEVPDEEEYEEADEVEEEAHEWHEPGKVHSYLRFFAALAAYVLLIDVVTHTAPPTRDALIFIGVAELMTLLCVFVSELSPRQRGHLPHPSYYEIYFGVPACLGLGFILSAKYHIWQASSTRSTGDAYIALAFVGGFIAGLTAFVLMMHPKHRVFRLLGGVLVFVAALCCGPLLFHYSQIPQ